MILDTLSTEPVVVRALIVMVYFKIPNSERAQMAQRNIIAVPKGRCIDKITSMNRRQN